MTRTARRTGCSAVVLAVVGGCGSNLDNASSDITIDRNTGQTYAISTAVLDACQLWQPTVQQLEDTEDIIQVFAVGARAGVDRRAALETLATECVDLDTLAELADCLLCSEAIVDQAYGPKCVNCSFTSIAADDPLDDPLDALAGTGFVCTGDCSKSVTP